jgi:glycosyltransferase involved in cell wall biosynthesis
MSSLPLFRQAVSSDEGVGARRPSWDVALPPDADEDRRISATILTRDSVRRLADVLDALAWCDEIVVLDTGSTDDTLAVARRYPNVSIHRLDGAFPGFGRAHREAVALAMHDWILSIDSDEVISPALADEIVALRLCRRTVYTVPFRNHFNGRQIRSCGWHGEWHERLFHRQVTNFCASAVHEKVQTRDLAIVALSQPVDHYSYESIDDFLRKMRVYSQLFADQNVGRKTSSPGRAVRHGAWAFVKSFVLQKGFLDGYEGFVISAYKAQTAFWKYLLLHEANRRTCA